MDETMSQDVAFTGNDKQDDVFKFDPVKEEETAPSAPLAENEETGADSGSQENKQSDVSSEEEKRVPYSRLKTVEAKLEERDSIIARLEERLDNFENTRKELEKPLDEFDVPREWVELYGDSDVSKRAFKIQMQREEQLQETAVKRALEQFRNEATSAEKAVEQNEEIIDNELSDLQQSLGKKFTPEIEEEILSIVDEFSPVGPDGKYTSLFPFDKANEIRELRNMKATRKTTQARNQVADLTGNSSEGEADSSSSTFKRGWDNWREAV